MGHERRAERTRTLLSCVGACGALSLSLACMGPQARAPSPVELMLGRGAQSSSPRASAGAWMRYRLGYTALEYELPGTPEVLHVGHDEVLEVARLGRDGDPVQYVVRSYPHDAVALNDVGQLVSASITQVVQRSGGARSAQSDTSVSGYPGADLVFDFPGDGSRLRVRLIVGRTQYYVLTVAYPAAAEATLQGDILRYHQSVRLDAGDRPELDGDGVVGAAQYVEPVGALFVMRFPGHPRREAGLFSTTALSRPRIRYSVRSRDGRAAWQVAVTAFEHRPPADVIERALDAWRAEGWSVDAGRPITTQGFAGRAYALRRDGGAIAGALRLFVTQARLYEAHVAGPSPEGDGRDAVAFLDSLRIL